MWKSVFVLFRPCPKWANAFSFFKSLAQAGQTCFYFLRALPALGKPFIFLFCLCPRRASLCFSLNTTNICLLCFTANGFAIFFAQDAVFRFRFAQTQAITSDKRRYFCSLTHESSRISRRRSLLAHRFINFFAPYRRKL